MANKKTFFLAALLALTSCDSGNIVEEVAENDEKGRAVKLSVRVSGMADLNEKYTLALAAFKSDDNYALTVYTIPATTEDNAPVSIVVPNLSSEVSTVELAIIDRLRQRVVSLESIDMSDYAKTTDTIRIDAGMVNVGMFDILQQHVFNVACIQCHGAGGGSGAAGLNLTEGQALQNLQDAASSRKEGRFRVVSGSASQSLLHQILAEGGEDILHYNHTEVLSSHFKNDVTAVRTFIDDWINGLKK